MPSDRVLSTLTAATTLAATDIVYVMQAPGGTPLDRYSTITVLGVGIFAASTALTPRFAGLGVGVVGASGILESRSTTTQLKLSYDGSNYCTATVGSTGGVTLAATGSGALFTFTSNMVVGTYTTTLGVASTAVFAAPNSNYGLAFSCIADGVGRGFAIFSNNFNNSSTGERMQINIDSGLAKIDVAKSGASAAGDLCLMNSGGHVLLGYTSSNGSYNLQVNSQIFATNATIATSDARYKDNVESIDDALDIICRMRPVTFNWKPHAVHNFVSDLDVGFLAQEIQTALADTPFLPSVVKANVCELPDGQKEDFLGLCEAKLIPLLVRSIQELTARVKSLEDLRN